MAKNMIQFQKGLSLPEFLSIYGTEVQCHQALFRMRWPNGFSCPYCGHTMYCELRTRKVFQCYKCRSQTSLTSGTIFADTKLGLSSWFLGIYLITQSKDGISSLNLARSLGISANAALRMKHKTQQVMKEREEIKPLAGYIQVDDSYMGGKSRGGKRGRGASGKTPFIAAVTTTEEGHPLAMKFNVISGFTKQEIADWAKKHIISGSVITSDGLGCFPGFEEAGCTHMSIVTGGGAASVDIPDFKWVNTMIGNLKNAIRGTHHSISRKHIPRYLAEFCYRFNRRFRLGEMIERFLWVAARTVPMPQRLLKLAEIQW
ncbi:MAG: IS1595 family transposase [Desulfobacteraceae bacterium]|nr:IS1595 family transposase [Desulfobacteraceae bacterium]MBU4055160.1 IS1595 family transposase [Pseudomonadota bacterium]